MRQSWKDKLGIAGYIALLVASIVLAVIALIAIWNSDMLLGFKILTTIMTVSWALPHG